jgi:2-polyprenyl-3-methyl-5-hydroxy-6-metoxy-1,4-benzoquinol methylase
MYRKGFNMEPIGGWESRTDVDVGLTHSLDLLADTYNYNHWIYSLLRPWLGSRILEVGAGIGNLTQFMLSAEQVVCVEPEAEYLHHLSCIASVHKNVTVCPCSVFEIPDQHIEYDSIVCVNVLEHIENDYDALYAMGSRLREGGRILLYVPAVQWAYGAMDEGLGHWRRYNRRMVRRLCKELQYSIIKMHYVNLIGLFGWWWYGRARRLTLIDPQKARFMDRLVPYLSATERILPIPAGQSLYAVLERNAQSLVGR